MVSKQKRVAVYLRVSTTGQTVENQRHALQTVADQRGWQIVAEYTDHGVSGSRGRDKRPQFDKLCKAASRGEFDLVAAWSIDRIGRSLAHLVEFVNELQEQRIGLFLHQQSVDSSTAAGRAMLGMCSVFAEFERSIIVERVKAGLDRARSQGKRLGRPTSVNAKVERQVRDRLAKGHGKIRIGRELGIGTSSVQRIAKALAT